MESIISYKDRGNWGSNKWRGNCSGHIIVDLINQYNPTHFTDITEGGGTSRDVCNHLNINYTGLDLHSGFDFTSMDILSKLKTHTDICFSHPPYHSIIKYSGNQWGERNNADLSHCSSIDEFLEKSQLMLINQRNATKNNGIYCSLIGDIRGKAIGGFYSLQSDYIQLMPKNELVSVVVKVQHNCLSDSRKYVKNFIPIKHEYLLIWKKSGKSIFHICWDKGIELKKKVRMTWRNLIRQILMILGGESSLCSIYELVEKLGSDLISRNKHWKAKIRQQLQLHHTNVTRGIWAL